MKMQFGGFNVHISEWSAKLKIATIVFATITAVSVALTIFGGYTIPGLSLIALGAMFQLLGIKAYNVYFKRSTSKVVLSAGIVSTLFFAGCLCVGIKQFLVGVI